MQKASDDKRLVLFDIDGTLVRKGKAHRQAFMKAFKEVLNLDLQSDDFGDRYQGFTDTGIIYDLMKRNEIKIDADTVKEIITVMIREFEKSDHSGMILIDGVENTLKELSRHNDIIIGLVTGNLESIAYGKLKHFNIREYFLLGGFGHISDVRSELITDAINQTEKKFGSIDKSRVFIIGDTHRDILAAKEAGVRVIAVATGHMSSEDLKQYNPDYLFEDLKDTKRVLEVIQHG
ncbi:MAG: HAD family hydrolase [Candidatus Woesearchaeota archaeon]